MAIEILEHGASVNKCQELATLIAQHTDRKGNGFHKTAIDKLEFVRESSVTTSLHGISEPVLGIVVQGKKEALLNQEIYRYGVAQYIVVSVELPLSGFIAEATSDKPYLGFKLKLDPNQLYDTIAAQTQSSTQITNKSVRGLFVSNADTSLIDCAIRLTQLLDTPQDIPFLAPIVIREIHYRLLMGEQGEVVRQIAIPGSNMQRIAEAIEFIKTYFTKSLRVEQLAKQVNMSTLNVVESLWFLTYG